jgi:hypothetical protein
MNVNGNRQLRKRKISRALVLLSITALALAASPAALADDCGGPGAPSADELSSSSFFLGPRKSPLRFASWSD